MRLLKTVKPLAQRGRYDLTGKHGFIASTGEKVICTRAIDCIINLLMQEEIDENILLERHFLWCAITNLYFLFNRITHWWNSITISDLPAWSNRSLWTHGVRISHVNLGQEGDIANHKKKIDHCFEQCPDAALILYGVSRGAATSFTAYAIHHYPQVKAVILEGCFDDIAHIVEEYLGSIGTWLYYRCGHFLSAHKPGGISPLKLVDQFPQDTPVLFITSQKDSVVLMACTKNLVSKLVAAGHKKVYLLELKNSSHTGYSFDDPDDAQNYQRVVHAFYKKYDILGYNEAYAQAGEALLTQYHQSM